MFQALNCSVLCSLRNRGNFHENRACSCFLLLFNTLSQGADNISYFTISKKRKKKKKGLKPGKALNSEIVEIGCVRNCAFLGANPSEI